MQNYEMDKNGLFRHKTNSKESPMQDFVITKQKYRKMSNILEPNISFALKEKANMFDEDIL